MSDQPTAPGAPSAPAQPVAIPERPPGAAPATPRESATVILLRDGEGGLEVFMLERHLSSDFFGGAYVFPGGTVDARDTDPAAARFLDGPRSPDAARLLDLPAERAAAFYLCAIRETFEEAGVLLAHRGGEIARLDDAERMTSYRRTLGERGGSLVELAEREGLRYAGDLLHYYARWITPEPFPKRYDARFFLARAPEGQNALHDDRETTASTWVRPQDALSRARDGRLSIIFPTRKTLESLTGFATVSDALRSTEGRPVSPTLPTVVMRDGLPKILLPNDPTLHDP